MKHTVKWLLCSVIGVVLLASALSADELPKLDFEKYTLSNGLDVILHEDHSIPMVSINIWYHVGSKNERPGRTGFAHIFEHMMFQGTPNVPGEYFEHIQPIGGVVNGSTNTDRTNYWENLPSNYLEMGLWMESDRMGFLLDGLTEEKLETQKSVVQNERRQRVDNSPYGRTDEFILSMMFPVGHPYSWSTIGRMEDLEAATMEDVSEFFSAYYTPSNASLCVAGDFDVAETKELIEKYFGTLPPGPPVERLETWIPEMDGVSRATVEDDVELGRVYFVWHTPGIYAPGDAEFDLLSGVLSAGKSSRLFKALKYDRQLAQTVSVYQRSREISSLFYIVITANPGQSLDEIEQIVDDELRRLLTEGITVEELERVRAGWEAGFVRGLESVGGFGGRADKLNGYNVHMGDPDGLAADMRRYTDATVESVMEFAHKYLDLNSRAILRVVPHGSPSAVDLAVERSVKPAPTAEPSFTPPEIQRDELDNGLEILLVEDHRLPLVQMNLVIHSGMSFDTPGLWGTAQMTADLLNEGTQNRTAVQISDESQLLGAQLGTGTGFDESVVYLNALKKNLDGSIELMADILLNPIFPQEELDRLRGEYQGRIQSQASQPFPTAYKALNRLLYGENHPYGQPYTGTGTEESLNAMTRDDCVNFYEKYYIPNNATVVIAGDITMAEAKSKLKNLLQDWKKGTVVAETLPEPTPPNKTTIYIVDRPGAEQSMIVAGNIGLAAGSDDALAFGVLDKPLGGQFVSRINMNLREDKGYTYGARAYMGTRRHPAPFYSYAPVQAEFTKESVFEIVKELKDLLGERPLTAEEIKSSKDSWIQGFPQDFQTLGAVAGQLQALASYDLPLDRWSTYVQRVNATTPADLDRVARQYIRPDELVIVIVGDKELIEPGLKDLNIGSIELLAMN